MSEKLGPNPDAWYRNLEEIAVLSPRERYAKLVNLHKITLNDYFETLDTLTDARAEEISPTDGRKRKIIVAHIMGWEDWQIQVLGNPNRLSNQLHMHGYEDPERGITDFSSVDEFNARQEELYYNYPWEMIKDKAKFTAKKLRSFFPDKASEEWLSFLDNTPLKTWHVTKDITITIPGGWFLWMVSLEHEAIEHKKDLLPNKL